MQRNRRMPRDRLLWHAETIASDLFGLYRSQDSGGEHILESKYTEYIKPLVDAELRENRAQIQHKVQSLRGCPGTRATYCCFSYILRSALKRGEMTWENVVRAYSLGAAVAPVLQCGGGSRRTRTDFAKVFRKVLSEHREWIVANGGFDHFLPSHLLVSQSTATRERQHLDLIDDADLTLDSLLQLQDSHQGDPAASGSPDEDLTLDRMVELNEEIEPGQEDSAATPDTSSTTTPESHDVIAMQSNLDDDGNSSLSNDDTVAFACKQCGSLTYASSQSVDCRTESTQQEDMDTDIANKDHTRTSADKNTDFVKKESVFANTNPDFLDTDPDYSNKDPDYTKTPDFADKGPDLANQDSDLPDVVLTMNDTCGLITGDPVAAKGEAVPGDDCDHLPVTTILLTTAVICFGGYAAYKAYQYFT